MTRSARLRQYIVGVTIAVLLLAVLGGAGFFVGRAVRANGEPVAAPPRLTIPALRLPAVSSLSQPPGFPSLATH